MSSNDLILLGQLLDQRLSEVGQGLSEEEYFEVFSAEQALKDDDLSYEELTSGVVDGGGDGGIDSFFFFINDVPFNDDIDVSLLKKGVHLRLALIQSKTSQSFSESAIDKMISSARDIFDLGKDVKALSTVYNKSLLDRVAGFRRTFLALTSKFPSVSFEYYYVTKGLEVHNNVERKVPALEQTIKGLFNPSTFSFKFITASNLLANARRSPSLSTSLRLAENPISTGQEGFVCLVSLRDYLAFITDEAGHLRSHLFEGNVRDYQGKTEVNGEIRRTLEEAPTEDFWWLNNGVSLICSDASLSGKVLTIKDAEIVNGLQSSREIFNALHAKDVSKEPRNLLVRVLKPQSQESRDRIIKATNSQTPIPPSSLRATDKIHRDIEEYLYSKGLYYDRRKNYYKNIGKPIKKIFGIPFVAQSVMACALSDPGNARARPSSLIKNEEAYRRIFNADYPIDIYLKCPLIVQMISEVLRQHAGEEYRKHLNNLLFYVSAVWTLGQTHLPNPGVQQIANIDIALVSKESVLPVAEEVWSEYVRLGGNDQVAKGNELGKVLIEKHRKQAIAAIMDSQK
ncbi:AIPR family protein [Fundidesulfovibrio soli]|uniref:AIPR family protein n=1 Tax=Fundidesulfovibrio soli TaxID=2922716 RepID=UPI001FAF3990|nr:AIPR family protein [Fundidesulfovibrio soli]